MGTVDGRLCFTAVPKTLVSGKQTKTLTLAAIPEKQLRLTQAEDQNDFMEESEEKDPQAEVMKALIDEENDTNAFDNQTTYAKFNMAKSEWKQRAVWARKDAKTTKNPGTEESPVANAKTTKTRVKKKLNVRDFFRKRKD